MRNKEHICVIRCNGLKCNQWTNVEIQILECLEREILKMMTLQYLVFNWVFKLKNSIYFHLFIVRYNPPPHTHSMILFHSYNILFYLLKPIIQDSYNRGQNCLRNLNSFFFLPENHPQIQITAIYELSYRKTSLTLWFAEFTHQDYLKPPELFFTSQFKILGNTCKPV